MPELDLKYGEFVYIESPGAREGIEIRAVKRNNNREGVRLLIYVPPHTRILGECDFPDKEPTP